MGHARLSSRHALGAKPVIVGRAPDCDVVIAHPGLSRRHAAVWMRGESVWIEDLKSRNGVFVDDVQITTETEIRPGQRVRLGSLDALRVRAQSVIERVSTHLLAVEDSATGYQVVLGPDPLLIGKSRECALLLPEGPNVAAIVVRQRDDEVWLGVDDDMTELVVDEPFEVAGRVLVVRAVPSSPAATIAEEAPSPWSYQLTADVDAAGGPSVVVEATDQSLKVQLHATNSAILLFVLARAWANDEEREIVLEDRGWIDDDTVAVGVWGKDGPLRQLKVLVCRLRQELREAGFDPWFVEKRRGALRVRVERVSLSD